MKTFSLSYTSFLLLFLMPLSYSPSDSTRAVIQISGGGGQYISALRSCQATQAVRTNHFKEICGAVKMESKGVVLAMNSTFYDCQEEQLYWESVGEYPDMRSVPRSESVNRSGYTMGPTVNFDLGYIGLGGGYLWSDNPIFDMESETPTAYVRIGPKDLFYFSSSYYHGIPLMSNGYIHAGIGGSTRDNYTWYTGLSSNPYDGLGLVFRSDIPLSQRLILNLNCRAGKNENNFEGGFNVGLSFVFWSE